MSLTEKLTWSHSSSGGPSLSGNVSEVVNTIQTPDLRFGAGTVRAQITLAFTQSLLRSVFIVCDQNATLYTNGVNDVQTVSVSGTPTGGSFTLTFGGQTATIPYNSIASAVQSLLQALSSINVGNLTCTGGPLPGTPVVCTFVGSLGLASQSVMTPNSSGLTGGSSPTASVAHTTTGSAAQDTINLIAGIPLVWSFSAGYFTCPFSGNVTTGWVTSSVASHLQIFIGSN